MALTQMVDIPESRQITLPREVPIGRANIVIFPMPEKTMTSQALAKETSHTVGTFAESARRYAKEQAQKAEEMEIKPGLGCLKGKIWMADDFNEPLEDFKDYM